MCVVQLCAVAVTCCLTLELVWTHQNGDTALTLAASYGHQAVVEVLLATGANLEATDMVSGCCCWAHTHLHWFIVGLYERSRVQCSEWWVQVCATSPSQLCA